MASQPEIEWDEQERAWMLALALYRERTCDGCGRDLAETTEHDAEAYRVSPPHRCGACTAIEISQDAYADAYKSSSARMGATRWRAELR
ncbi:MAG TPA: hypothetical protein VL652_34690 [Kutzneria sp.]|nr:hypothetical protein [Kutzneria sp.]